VFCFQELPFHAHNVVANISPGSSNNNYTVQTLMGTSDHPIGAPCTPGNSADQNAVVYVRKPDGSLTDPDTSAKLYVLFN
jgi:hypothetical protein